MCIAFSYKYSLIWHHRPLAPSIDTNAENNQWLYYLRSTAYECVQCRRINQIHYKYHRQCAIRMIKAFRLRVKKIKETREPKGVSKANLQITEFYVLCVNYYTHTELTRQMTMTRSYNHIFSFRFAFGNEQHMEWDGISSRMNCAKPMTQHNLGMCRCDTAGKLNKFVILRVSLSCNIWLECQHGETKIMYTPIDDTSMHFELLLSN